MIQKKCLLTYFSELKKIKPQAQPFERNGTFPMWSGYKPVYGLEKFISRPNEGYGPEKAKMFSSDQIHW